MGEGEIEREGGEKVVSGEKVKSSAVHNKHANIMDFVLVSKWLFPIAYMPEGMIAYMPWICRRTRNSRTNKQTNQHTYTNFSIELWHLAINSWAS